MDSDLTKELECDEESKKDESQTSDAFNYSNILFSNLVPPVPKYIQQIAPSNLHHVEESLLSIIYQEQSTNMQLQDYP
jgi:hypothetical protein